MLARVAGCRIAVGWLLSWASNAFLLAIYIVYGCTYKSLDAADNSESFAMSWLISNAQGWLVMVSRPGWTRVARCRAPPAKRNAPMAGTADTTVDAAPSPLARLPRGSCT